MENNQPILSICIPTYNRKERLLSQLRSIYCQEMASQVKISICDNHSNYDVQEAIELEFGSIPNNTIVISNKVNIGGNANIASTFMNCKTKWMWLLSDDDETAIDSICSIFSDIQRYPHVSMFKYSIIGQYHQHDDIEICSIEQFIKYFRSGFHTSGDMIFMSNNVYNLEALEPYLGIAIKMSSCCIPHLLPIFEAMDNYHGSIRFRSKQIVTYLPPTPGSSWNYIQTALGISTISHIQYKNYTLQDIHNLSWLVIRDFNHYGIISSCLHDVNKERGKYNYCNIYRNTLKFSPSIYDKLLHILFYIRYYFPVSSSHFIALVKKMKSRK